MPQAPDWKRYLEAGMQFTEMRRGQARQLATDLAAQGHLARDQVAATVDEMVAMSRRRSEELREIVRSEVQRQLGALGLATKADLARLERTLNATKRTNAAGTATKTKAPAKKAAAKKTTPARKVAAKKKVPAKKSSRSAAAKKAG
ncbi:MAG: hypothetical protein ACT4OX_07190 [Actinomycetota bacterium]